MLLRVWSFRECIQYELNVFTMLLFTEGFVREFCCIDAVVLPKSENALIVTENSLLVIAKFVSHLLF